jgi:hypothetical protein
MEKIKIITKRHGVIGLRHMRERERERDSRWVMVQLAIIDT